MRDTAQRRELLAGVPIFGRLEQHDLEALARVARSRKLRAGTALFHKGDEGSQVFVILSGRLKAMSTSADGHDVVFGIMDPGEVFGELALLAGGVRSATVIAVDDCELLVLDRRDFLPFLRAHPDAAVRMLETLSERLCRISEFVEDTLFLNLPRRLAKKLVALAEAYGQECGEGILIDLRLSQTALGDMVGTTRESINKLVKTWSEAGLVNMEGGYITIRRLRELRALAGLSG